MVKHKILLQDGTVLTSGRDAGACAIRSVKLTEQVSDQTDLAPGAACAACAEIELWAPENCLQIRQGDTLTLFRTDSLTGTEEQVGLFLAEKPVKASANVCKVTAYDRMTLLDRDLSPWLREQQSAFPLALTDFIRAVCTRCGVEPAGNALTDLPNGDYRIPAFYADGLTGRQLIQWAAQAASRFARMTPEGTLTFGWYSGVQAAGGLAPTTEEQRTALHLAGAALRTAAGEVWRFGRSQVGYLQGGLSYETYTTAPLDKVQIRQSESDVGVIYPADGAGDNALVIQGNLLLTAAQADTLRPVAQYLFESLRDISYTPLSVELPADGYLPEPGTGITVQDAYGRVLQTFVMQRTITGQKAVLQATGHARRDAVSAVNNRTLANLQGKMLEIRTEIDGLNVKASEMQGDHTELAQTVDGLELTVVRDGEVRTAFAADDTSVSIRSGLITFSSNTLEVESDHFNLDRNGTVSASGVFRSDNGNTGSGRNEAVLSSGSLVLTRTVSDGTERDAAEIFSEGSNASHGSLYLYGTNASNNGQSKQCALNTGFSGGNLALNAADGTNMILLAGSQSGYAMFAGQVDVKESLGVAHGISCQSIDVWGGKSRVVPTSFGNVRMSAFETPTPAFADFGSGVCDETGQCCLVPDPRFSETLSAAAALYWLVTAASPGSFWVEKQGQNALVHGQPGAAFDWMCYGVQKGCEGEYAEATARPAPPAANPADGELDYLDSMEEQMERALYGIWEPFDLIAFTNDLMEVQQ